MSDSVESLSLSLLMGCSEELLSLVGVGVEEQSSTEEEEECER